MVKQIEVKSRLLSALSNLEEDKVKTVNEIAKETDTHPNTVKTNIDEIELIQDFPKIEIIKSKSQTMIRLKKKEKDMSYIVKELGEIKKLLKKRKK